MTTHSRRDFIRKSAGAVGAAAAAMAMPPSIRRALAVDAHVGSRTIRDVRHVVVLMQENRSFNHYFGTLRGVRGFGDRLTVPLESGNSVWFQSNGTRDIGPYHLDSETMNALLVPSTPHSFADAQAAWNQGKFGFWPKYKNQYSMGYYRREDIPFQFALAEAFTLCDDYHCSITTGTDPNRIVFWSGSNFNPELRAQGINSDDDQSEPNNFRCWPSPATWVPGVFPHSYGYQGNGFTWDTIPDVLQRAGVTWRIYQDMNDNWTGAMNGILAFESFRTARPGSPLYENGLTGGPDYLERFAKDVAEGTLPEVSWILPTRANSEHPGGPSSPTHGSDFTADVLDALTANPEVWSKTVFFLTFDENDGLFDHLPAPAVPSYNADGSLAGKATLPLAGHYFTHGDRRYLAADDTISGTTRPWGMGPRVPMYVVSPWSKGGWVNSQVFDHTSVGMFLEKRFGIRMTTISPWHRAVVGDLTSAFDFEHPNDRRFPELPDQSHWPESDARQRTLPAPTAPATPVPLFQEPGVRYSRALPYELHTRARVDSRSGTVTLQFDNTGRQGAVFHVYDKLHLDRIPRRYTVQARKSLEDSWAIDLAGEGTYDLEVFGPNGFFRSFKGHIAPDRRGHDGDALPEIRVRYDVRRRAITLSARNDGRRSLTLTVTANAYRTDGPWRLHLAPGREQEKSWSVHDSGNWYDFTVASTSAGFERRFAGRLETGRDGVSDPAMATELT
jgi:phospholipase C